MHTVRWWQFGLVGGFTLALATAVKLVARSHEARPAKRTRRKRSDSSP